MDKKVPIFGRGLLPLSMERVKGGGILKSTKEPMGVVWRGINEGWESFSKHLALVLGDGSHILFWHYRWVGDNPLKMLYPQLYACSNDKVACIYDCCVIRRVEMIEFGT